MPAKCQNARKYFFDQNFFQEIDTPEKAYYLGLMFSDGCISNGFSTITLHKDDKSTLVRFKNALKHTGDLILIKDKYYKFSFCSTKTSNDLKNHGCVERKSLILKFPTPKQVPDNLIRHFIRGYFDGDGSFYYGKSGAYVDIAGTESFCKSLSEIIKLELNMNSGIRPIKNIFRIRIHGTRQVIKFLNWLYFENKNIYMERKFIKYKNFIYNYKYNIENFPNNINRSNYSKLDSKIILDQALSLF